MSLYLDTLRAEDSDLGKNLENLVRLNAVVYKIQNVSDYLEGKKLDLIRELPKVTPPFPLMWFEWGRNGFHHGMVLSAEKDGQVMGGHNCHARLFLGQDGVANADIGGVNFKVGADGRLDEKIYADYFMKNVGEDTNKELGQAYLFCSLFAISLMHCKNVQTEQSPPPDKALQEARARRGKKPLLRFHTIKIGHVPGRGRHGRCGPHEEAAFHIVRGHFKTFDGKPLFGRYRGTYWWPMLKRGNPERGVVLKDYEVFSPSRDAEEGDR